MAAAMLELVAKLILTLTKEVYETEVITLVLVVEKAVSFIEVKIDEIVVKLDM
ncbi:hypothetical protein BofuT4_uP056640.1 [Botrytis cinerea T4]|uniref:Uncharacterized protein n=1 Tax=Botryotinia fuckeliana (strain T4) TaxID=999810 RepID=G2XW93_BOTF4|nr:hypothetical protein BofuT4_uP056640.1 [Botrytis cinerea T4]